MHGAFRVNPCLCAGYGGLFLVDRIGEIVTVLAGGISLYRQLFYGVLIYMTVCRVYIQVVEAVSGFTVSEGYPVGFHTVSLQNDGDVRMHGAFRINPCLCAGYGSLFLVDCIGEVITVLAGGISLYRQLFYGILVCMAVCRVYIQVRKAVGGLAVCKSYLIYFCSVSLQNDGDFRMYGAFGINPCLCAGYGGLFRGRFLFIISIIKMAYFSLISDDIGRSVYVPNKILSAVLFIHGKILYPGYKIHLSIARRQLHIRITNHFFQFCLFLNAQRFSRPDNAPSSLLDRCKIVPVHSYAQILPRCIHSERIRICIICK